MPLPLVTVPRPDVWHQHQAAPADHVPAFAPACWSASLTCWCWTILPCWLLHAWAASCPSTRIGAWSAGLAAGVWRSFSKLCQAGWVHTPAELTTESSSCQSWSNIIIRLCLTSLHQLLSHCFLTQHKCRGVRLDCDLVSSFNTLKLVPVLFLLTTLNISHNPAVC